MAMLVFINPQPDAFAYFSFLREFRYCGILDASKFVYKTSQFCYTDPETLKAHNFFMPGILDPNRRDHKDLGATFRRIFKCIFLHFILKSLTAKEYPQRPYKALKGLIRPLGAL